MTPVRVLFVEPFGFRFVLWKDGFFPLGELRTNSKAMEWKGSLRAQNRVDFGQLGLRRNLEFDLAAGLADDDLIARIGERQWGIRRNTKNRTQEFFTDKDANQADVRLVVSCAADPS